jgi:hypothetical protein
VRETVKRFNFQLLPYLDEEEEKKAKKYAFTKIQTSGANARKINVMCEIIYREKENFHIQVYIPLPT